MSLYYEAASFIGSSGTSSDSLRLSVYASNRSSKNPPGKLYALLSETLKCNEALKEVIESAGLLQAERKITAELSLVLVHDLLFRPKGIEAPASHPLRAAIERHKTRLSAELTRIRVRRRCGSIEALKAALQRGPDAQNGHGSKARRPRWVRINRLATTVDEQLATTFKGFEKAPNLSEVAQAQGSNPPKVLWVDAHIPDLVAVPAQTPMDVAAYKEGKIILQDKASCFPAYMLDPKPGQTVIDACAAPGNKTTHLASLLARHGQPSAGSIYAIERDRARSKLLQQMVEVAHADACVVVKKAQDFLQMDPNSADAKNAPWAKAEALLLDPSCSGSGIVGREEGVQWSLPSAIKDVQSTPGKKRKRGKTEADPGAQPKRRPEVASQDVEIPGQEDSKTLEDRLSQLGAFQLRVLQHALSFPNAMRVVYSTCSVHHQENEDQVLEALKLNQQWRVLPREKQPSGMRDWPIRGILPDDVQPPKSQDMATIMEACIRCNKHDEHGTQGFFVVAFERATTGANR